MQERTAQLPLAASWKKERESGQPDSRGQHCRACLMGKRVVQTAGAPAKAGKVTVSIGCVPYKSRRRSPAVWMFRLFSILLRAAALPF